MPNPTQSQRIEDLTKEVQRLGNALDTYKQLTELRFKVLQDEVADRKKVEDELRSKVADLTAKNAMLEERSRGQEKTADRGWQLWLAALGFGFGLISLLITAAFQLRK